MKETTEERTTIDQHGAAVTIHDDSGRRVERLSGHSTFGRHPSNTHQVRDRIVSKQHCEIVHQAGRYVVRDLKSLNGTFVNGLRVEERILLDGDEIGLGAARLVFHASVVANEGETTVIEDGDEEFGAHHSPTERSYIMNLSQDQVRRLQRTDDTRDPQSFLPFAELANPIAQERDYERLRAAFEIARAVGAETELEPMFEKLLDTAMRILPANRGAILLLDAAEVLVVRCARQNGMRADDSVAVSNTILDKVVEERAGVLSNDTLSDERFSGAQSVILQGIRSTMAVPLMYQQELLGVLVLDSQQATNVFGEKDLDLLQTMAYQAAGVVYARLLGQRLQEQRKTREDFERLLSPAVVDQVVRGEVELKKGGEIKPVTVLFCDIRGFTAMTESYDAQQVVDLLNEYFELMVEVVFRHHGALDKLVGDEIMALFGVPMRRVDDAERAVRTALEMLSVLRVFNHARKGRGMPPVEIGVGITSGDVVAGYSGSSKALSYTVIGDPVNTGARLCDLAKPGQILISESTQQLVQGHFELRELEPVNVKGKAQALRIFEVVR